MNAVAVHIDPEVRATLTEVLEAAGWRVEAVCTADEALEACRRPAADVLLVGEDVPGGTGTVLDRVKRDAELFRTAVVLVGSRFGVDEALAWLQRGAEDVLRTPLDPADVVSRAFAAGRTKALVEELTMQNERLEDLLLYDELTRLRNRRATMQEVEMLLAAARRHGHQLSVLMLDIDRFKPINDRYGHRAGDEVLREIGRRVSQRLRTEDVAGRLGGDELLVALPGTDADGAAVAAEAIREEVARRPVETDSGPIPVTVSVGSATWAGEEIGVLLERADGALYAAKGRGRDRAEVA